MFKKLFAKKVKTVEVEESIVPVPIPAFVSLLLSADKSKGEPLTEDEVINIRDNMVCMNMKVSAIETLAESRGYDDLDPENSWVEWVSFREWYYSESS